MKYTIEIGSSSIILEHDDLDQSINVDDLTKIDTSNIFGEAVTIPAAVNRIGLLKAEVGGRLAESKLERKIFEGNYIAKLRKQAAKNSGRYKIRVGNEDVEVKISETGLRTCFENDPEWIELQKACIIAEKNLNALESLYWAVQDKSRKINGLVGGTTPEEFVKGLVEGKVNGMLITK